MPTSTRTTEHTNVNARTDTHARPRACLRSYATTRTCNLEERVNTGSAGYLEQGVNAVDAGKPLLVGR